MKKVIDGKLYDTEKATLLHQWDNNYQRGDAHYVSIDLYKTKNDNYFLHIFGGALSEYGEKCGNQWHPDQFITQLLPDAVVPWLEKHDGTDAILDYFPESIQEA